MTSAVNADTQAQLGKIARGGALNLVGSVVSAVTSFLLVVAVANFFDTQRAGMLFAATSLFLILQALTSLGTDTGLARFLLRFEADGRHRDIPTAIRSAIVPTTAAAIVVAVALFLLAEQIAPVVGLGDPGGVEMLRVAAVGLPFATLNDVALAATRAFGKMRPTVLVDSILRCTLQLLAAVAVGAAGAGVVALAGSWTLPYLLTGSIAAVVLIRTLRHRASGWPEVATGGSTAGGAAATRREFWVYTWPRAVARLCQIAIQRVDIILVAALIDARAAAIYTAATRFVVLGQFSQIAIQRVLQPRLTALLARDDHGTVRDVFKVSTSWSIALSWPMYLAAACAAPLYLDLFGAGYRDDGVEVVVVMAIGMMLAMAAGPLDTLLLMAGGSTTSLWNSIVALVIDVGLCLVLIPRWGIVGAAVAWAAAVVVRNALTLVQVHRIVAVTPFSPAGTWVAAASVLCFAGPLLAVNWFGTLDGLTFMVSMALAVPAYGAALWFRREPLALSAFAALRPGRSTD